MKQVKNLLASFLIGVGIGSLIECGFTLYFQSLIVATPGFLEAHSSLVFVRLVQTLIYGGFGLVSGLASSLFYQENQSIFKATTLHIIVLLSYFTFAGLYLHWFESLGSLILSILSFLIIYAIIWTLIYLSEKKKVEKMNRRLKEL